MPGMQGPLEAGEDREQIPPRTSRRNTAVMIGIAAQQDLRPISELQIYKVINVLLKATGLW